ncbi:MAG: ATP-binding cassette domain-containing protein, partial [Clostridia bacterium]|nr:ATP-binding cassette domain-containing protein [Clostridia bacterium]
TSVPLTEIDEICIEQCIATGRLTYKFNNEYYSLGCFSIGLLAQAECFVKVFNNFKDNKDYKMYIDSIKKSVCKKCGTPVPPGRVFCKKCTGKSSTVKRLFSFFKEVRLKMLFFIFSILFSTALTLIIPQFSTQKLYDEVLNSGNTSGYDVLLSSLISLVGTIALLKILQWIFTFVYQYIIAGMLPWVIYSIKLKIFTAMQKLSVGFYTHKQTGSLMERVTRDSNNIYWFFVDGFPYVITNAITVLGIFAIMFFTSWKLTLILIFASATIVIAYPIVEKIFRKLHHKVWVQNSNLTSKVSDNINGHRIIKAFSKETEEYENFGNMSKRLMNAEIKASNSEATVFPILSILIYALSAIVLGVGGVLSVKYNELTIGELLTFVVYLQMLQGPVEFLSWVTNWWARCVDSAQRVFEIMDTEPDIKEPENPVELKNFKGDIELNELQFEYEPAQPIIKNLSLKINSGEMLGIVGKTGAGKTTISNLIARLYDPKEGSVKIDGVDVKNLPMKQLKENIGIVSQDIFLFMGTIADNIRYARPEATNDEVIAAAKAASAHSFITKLPDGYETFVGSGGQDLSGGERQRISIARTIIQNPKILILDEATAAMDTETERNIQNSLSELKEGRTTISIAHRLSTLRDADKLAVIEDGECIEYGTYSELMEKKGEYYRLFKLQEEALKFIGIGENNDEETEDENGNN